MVEKVTLHNFCLFLIYSEIVFLIINLFQIKTSDIGRKNSPFFTDKQRILLKYYRKKEIVVGGDKFFTYFYQSYSYLFFFLTKRVHKYMAQSPTFFIIASMYRERNLL